MINSDLRNNELGNCGTSLSLYHKRPPIALKKVALRDVQNDSRSITHNDAGSCILGVVANDGHVSGTKRLTPECPIKPRYHQSWRSNGAIEHLAQADRNFDSELGKRRVPETSVKMNHFQKLGKYFHNQPELPQRHFDRQENNTFCVPASAPTPIALTTISPEVSHSADFEGSRDHETKEQFLPVQRPLKLCDDYDQMNYIQRLRPLSPYELSRYAVELEKRSIQLSIEEGKEINRMKALNIFQKS